MRILIAPDKFKGSLTANEVCRICAKALPEVNADLKIETVPMADGGDGTAEVLTTISKGTFVALKVKDPLFRDIDARYGLSRDRNMAFIEMASASGLELLKTEERDCRFTTSFGTGQMIADALGRGVMKIILGIGGSATNDAGMGMATALGYRFLDSDGNELAGIGRNLGQIQRIDGRHSNPKLSQTDFVVLCDVTSPLHGPTGAAFVYARQKGADDTSIQELDKGLAHFEQVASQFRKVDLTFPGAGAAGGLGAGAKLFMNAALSSGIEFIIEYSNLEEKIKTADIVITGEGKIDQQTLSGKVVKGITDLARRYKKRIVLICGICELEKSGLSELGAERVISLVSEGIQPEFAMKNAASLLNDGMRTLIF